MMCLLHDIFNVVRHINDPPLQKKKKIELDFIVVAFLLLWVVGVIVVVVVLCFAFAPLANLLFSVVVLNF